MAYYENLLSNQQIAVLYHHYIKIKVKNHSLKILINTKNTIKYNKKCNSLSMIKAFCAIIENCHDVRVIVFIVIVK